MTIKGIIEAIRHRKVGYKVSKRLYKYFKRLYKHLESKQVDMQHFAKRYIFDDRQSGSENLLFVLMGFQPYYWAEY